MTDLKLDFDGKIPPGFEGRLAWLAAMCGWRVREVWYRRTRHGWHVGVRLGRRLTPLRVIAAQAILGSDWRREAYNLMKWRRRHRADTPEAQHWNVLFLQKL